MLKFKNVQAYISEPIKLGLKITTDLSFLWYAKVLQQSGQPWTINNKRNH
jgi:hypothetical protein